MAEKKQSALFANIEIIIVAVFFIGFILWAMSKCSATRNKYAEGDAKAELERIKDSLAHAPKTPRQAPVVPSVATPSAQPSATNEVATLPVAPKPVTPITPAATPPPPKPVTPKGAILYVTIDGLNVRTSPELKAKSLGKLPLYAEVTFLNETTKESQKLSIGKATTEEPWVKIKTKRGTVGWVYGAGVSYYKTKRKGTLE